MTCRAVCLSAPIEATSSDAWSSGAWTDTIAALRGVNSRHGVTGAAILLADRIILWLEGSPERIDRVLETLSDGAILGDLSRLCTGDVDGRLFGDCSLYALDAQGQPLGSIDVPTGPVALEAAAGAFAPLSGRLAPSRQLHRAMLV